VVGYHKGVPVERYMPMEIMQDKKSGKKGPETPEWIRNPGIQVVIRLGGRIIGNHRRSIIIVVVVDNLWSRTHGVIICWDFSLFPGWAHGRLRLTHCPNHFDYTPGFLGDGFISVRVMDNPLFIDKLIDDGIGSPPARGSLSNRLR
jgi:hypothetical protein